MPHVPNPRARRASALLASPRRTETSNPRARRASLVAALFASLLLAACTFTGRTFDVGGLDRIVVGRTTLEQASEYLGALPDQTWRQGDTVLARWGYKSTAATDAVYFRQEAWLRFGPDGTFQRMENTINIPGTFRPRTQAQADQEAAEAAARQRRADPRAAGASQAAGPASNAGFASGSGPGSPAGAAPADRGTANAAPEGQAVPQAVDTPQPLLPPGTTYTPGVSYPIGRSGA